MKNILFSILLIFCAKFSAQSTVTSTEMLTTTLSQVTTNTVELTGLNVTPGPSGANVAWDFTGYNSTNSSITVTSACPGSNHCDQFTTANRIANQLDNNSYFNINSIDAQTLGSYNSILNSKVIYSDTKKNYQFPITYGQTFTDTYNYYLQGNPDVTTGTVSSEVDGYGILFTAFGTIANVLRIKRIDNYVVPNVALPNIPGYFSEETYEWIGGLGQTFLVYRIANGTVNGIPIPTVTQLYYTSFISQLSTQENNLKNKISIFPNPVQDEIFITSDEDIKEIQMLNADGRLIQKINQNFEKIDVRNLTKGMYILIISTKNGTYSEKFIKTTNN